MHAFVCEFAFTLQQCLLHIGRCLVPNSHTHARSIQLCQLRPVYPYLFYALSLDKPTLSISLSLRLSLYSRATSPLLWCARDSHPCVVLYVCAICREAVAPPLVLDLYNNTYTMCCGYVPIAYTLYNYKVCFGAKLTTHRYYNILTNC